MKTILIILFILFHSALSAQTSEYLKHIPESSYRWNAIYLSIVHVESLGNHQAIGTKGDGGVLQILPEGKGGYLDEANRILGRKKFTNEDRFCPTRSREIWEVVMAHRNPDKNIDLAIRLHNPKARAWYREKVMKEYRKLIKDGKWK